MAITKEQTTFTKRGGIYYTDQANFTADEDILTCEKIVFTDDVDLIDTRINQVSARHLKQVLIKVRNKV